MKLKFDDYVVICCGIFLIWHGYGIASGTNIYTRGGFPVQTWVGYFLIPVGVLFILSIARKLIRKQK
jgi:TRAP-type C4-dicarboxylate transport system permease small subunit